MTNETESVNSETENDVIYLLKLKRTRLIEDMQLMRMWQNSREEILIRRNNVSFPTTKHLYDSNLFLYKGDNFPTNSDGVSTFAVVKTDTLNFDRYVINNVIYKLPDDLKAELDCKILVYFDEKEKKIVNYGVVGRKMQKINTFHSQPTHCCLNDSRLPFDGVDFNDVKTILKGIDIFKDIVETINPYSFLNEKSTITSTRLKKIYTFVEKKRMESDGSGNNDGDERCGNCGEQNDDCSCDLCQDCNRPFDLFECDCDFCTDCGDRIDTQNYDECDCYYCGDCDARYRNDDNCDCDFCTDCGDRIKSDEYEECKCERCDDCEELNDDCECTNTNTTNTEETNNGNEN